MDIRRQRNLVANRLRTIRHKLNRADNVCVLVMPAPSPMHGHTIASTNAGFGAGFDVEDCRCSCAALEEELSVSIVEAVLLVNYICRHSDVAVDRHPYVPESSCLTADVQTMALNAAVYDDIDGPLRDAAQKQSVDAAIAIINTHLLREQGVKMELRCCGPLSTQAAMAPLQDWGGFTAYSPSTVLIWWLFVGSISGEGLEQGIKRLNDPMLQLGCAVRLAGVVRVPKSVPTKTLESWKDRQRHIQHQQLHRKCRETRYLLELPRVPLTPVMIDFFTNNSNVAASCLHHYNQSILCSFEPVAARSTPVATRTTTATGRFQPGPLRHAVGVVMQSHAALRFRFVPQVENPQYVCCIVPSCVAREDASVVFEHVFLGSGILTGSELSVEIVRRNQTAQESLNFSAGPLWRVVLYDLPQGEQRLLIVAHHLIVDVVSWYTLLPCLLDAYDQVMQASDALPCTTSGFDDWAWHLTRLAGADMVLADVDYWLTASTEMQRVFLPLLTDSSINGKRLQQTRMGSVTLRLSPSVTPQLLRHHVVSVLLSSLAVALRSRTQHRLLVLLEGHGRETLGVPTVGDNCCCSPDPAAVVGWCTSLYPFLLPAGAEASVSYSSRVRDALMAVPHNGFTFGVLKDLCSREDIRRHLRSSPRPEVSFNYLGVQQQQHTGIIQAKESMGCEIHPHLSSCFKLNINGGVEGDSLIMAVSYDTHAFRDDGMVQLVDEWKQAVLQLLELNNS